MRRSSKELGHLLGVLFDLGSAAGQSDGQLVSRLAAGGAGAELAFQAVVERHGPMVLRVCRRVLRDPHEAHDAYQATFLVLARRAGSIRDPDALASWLHGVALRAAGTLKAEAARRRRHEQRAAEARHEWTDAPDLPDPELGLALHREIARLPDRERLTVVLCDVEGRSYQEAASRLGCPVGTVKSRLSTARSRLRSRLIRRGIAPAGAIAAALADLAQAAPPPVSWALNERTFHVATSFATRTAAAGSGVVPGTIAALAERTIHAMVLSKLKVLALVCGLFVTTATLVYAQSGPAQQPASDARLQALESKLDRLIQVLERQNGGGGNEAVKSTGASSSARSHATVTTPANEPAKTSTVTVYTKKTADGEPAKTASSADTITITGTTGQVQLQSGDPTPNAISADTLTIVADGQVKTIQATPADPSTWKATQDDRLDKIERRLQMLSNRIDRIEKSVFGQATPDAGASTSGADVKSTLTRYYTELYKADQPKEAKDEAAPVRLRVLTEDVSPEGIKYRVKVNPSDDSKPTDATKR